MQTQFDTRTIYIFLFHAEAALRTQYTLLGHVSVTAGYKRPRAVIISTQTRDFVANVCVQRISYLVARCVCKTSLLCTLSLFLVDVVCSQQLMTIIV